MVTLSGIALDPKMSSERDKMIFELEQRLAQVGRKLSAEDASSLIADDFLEFGASGKVWTKAEIISAMSQWNPIERIVEEFTVRELSDSVCLVTYKVIGVDRQPSPFSLRSSIWRNNGETWQILFHQGTSVK
ncbi:MAG TPA: nuclear transport factor 2 family protein [Candidatus Binatia bacterium]|nr:nuclear transport factor 2 family protein [Candidatus Binatia bacterium]